MSVQSLVGKGRQYVVEFLMLYIHFSKIANHNDNIVLTLKVIVNEVMAQVVGCSIHAKPKGTVANV